MSLVDDDGELAPPVIVADGVQDERELLDGSDDDALAILEQGAEMAGAFGMAHDRADLANCLMVSRICLSSILRSVTTMAESESALPSCSSPINWWANHAMEFDLPLAAEC